MKLYGSISELVSAIFRKNSQALTFRPNQATTYTAARDFQLPPGDAAHVLTSADSTQTLTNKSISGASNTLTALPASALTGQVATANGGTGQNSTATFPTSGVVVTEAATETLTNKTMSGASNTFSNIPAGTALTGQVPTANGGTGQNSTATFPTSGVVVTEAATETLTNKTMSGASNTFSNIPAGTALTGQVPTANGGTGVNSTATFPSSGVVVTEAATETLTNKTLTSPVVGTDAQFSNQAVAKFYEQSINGTNFIGLKAPDAVTADASFKLPGADGVSGQVLTTDGAGNLSFGTPAASQDSPFDLKNYTLACSVGSSALTIALKNKAGNDPSGGDSVNFSFRNATAATGTYSIVSVTAATSLVISSGSTLGHTSGAAYPIYVYALNNAGTVVLAASSTLYDEGTVQSTTAEGGAGAADSFTTIYSTAAQTSKAIRLIGRLYSTQTTAGTWAAVPTEIALQESPTPASSIAIANVAGEYSANTRDGRMTYVHGTNYNGGNAPTVTIDVGGSIKRAAFVPYQMADGSWRCKVAIDATNTSAQTSVFSVNGLVCKNVSSYFQAGTANQVNDATTYPIIVYCTPNTGNFLVKYSASVTSACWFGDIELESKPTWAY